jgi:hypothetical protein
MIKSCLMNLMSVPFVLFACDLRSLAHSSMLHYSTLPGRWGRSPVHGDREDGSRTVLLSNRASVNEVLLEVFISDFSDRGDGTT